MNAPSPYIQTRKDQDVNVKMPPGRPDNTYTEEMTTLRPRRHQPRDRGKKLSSALQETINNGSQLHPLSLYDGHISVFFADPDMSREKRDVNRFVHCTHTGSSILHIVVLEKLKYWDLVDTKRVGRKLGGASMGQENNKCHLKTIKEKQHNDLKLCNLFYSSIDPAL